jgi:mRNA interferase MazF
MKSPRRGEVYLVNLDPTVGKEIKKTRPVLVVQTDTYNKYGQTTVVAPITSNISKSGPSKVLIIPPEGGLNTKSAVLIRQIRTVDGKRLIKKLGTVEKQTLNKVNEAIVVCLISG